MRPKRITILMLFAVAACLVVVAALAYASVPGYVSRSGTKLTLDGKTWKFIAYNDYELPSISGAYQCGQAQDQADLDAVMQDIRNAGGTVVRTWFFQSYYDLDNTGQPMPPSYAAFDRVLAAAAQYGLKVIPVLTNEYPTCEPGAADKDLSFYQGGYTQPQDGYPLSFQNYAATITAHYADTQAIAFWQIGNELSVGTSGCSGPAEKTAAGAMRSFADAMTRTIKAADPNHLVSLGTIGSGQCGLEGPDYKYVQAGGIDICDYHDYNDPTHSLPSDGYNRLAQRIAECNKLKKPLVITESGIPADVSDTGGETGTISTATLEARAGFFAAKMAAAFGAGVSGYGIWEKQQTDSDAAYGIADQSEYEVGPDIPGGDPTNTATRAMAARLYARTQASRFTFEDRRVDGWAVNAGSGQLSNSAAEAWDGFRSLALNLTGRTQNTTIGTASTAGAGAHTTVVFHVYLPEAAPDTLSVRPQVVNRTGKVVRGPTTVLTAGWNTISWMLPARGVKRPLRTISLAVLDPQKWAGAVYVDGIAWGR